MGLRSYICVSNVCFDVAIPLKSIVQVLLSFNL